MTTTQKLQINGSNGGRSLTLTKTLAKRICFELAQSTSSLKALCLQHPEWPSYGHLRDMSYERAWFADMMKRARQEQADHLVQNNMDVAKQVFEEKGVSMAKVQAARIMFEDRRWYTSKVLPGMYGDNAMSVNVDARTAVVVGDEQIKELRGRLNDARKLVSDSGTKDVQPNTLLDSGSKS